MNVGHRGDTATTRGRGRRGGFGALIAATAIVAASCGGGDDADSDAGAGDVEVPDADDLIADPEGAAEDIAESLEEVQRSQGGGSATFVVGDQSWTFASVLCAFGEDQIGQEGAEFNLSSIQDGMQMYASIDRFGHSLSLNDIADFENPAVDLSSVGDDFIVLEGKNVTAEAEFMDGTTDDITTISGTFEATCP